MKNIALVTIASATTALCLSAACGSSDTNCTASTVTVTVTATGGHGGQGGGTGATGAGGQGSRSIGEHCSQGSECASGLCLDEEHTGWGTGYCAQFCNAVVHCPDGSTCFTGDSSLGQICLTSCDPSGTGSECSSAQGCFDLGDGSGVCMGGCAATQDCPDMKNCDPSGGPQDAQGNTFGSCNCSDDSGCPRLGNCEPDGYCYLPEVCNDGIDNEPDGLTDCEDTEDCGTACAAQYTAACTAAVDAQATNVGDTTGGTALFAGSCTGARGALENIFTYTPTTADVTVHLSLTSPDTDQGIYVRSACSDPTTELACQDQEIAGGTAQLFLPVSSTDPLFIFVDGFDGPASAGAYTLDVSELASATETEPNNAWSTANAAPAGTIVTAQVSPAGDDDWYSVALASAGTLTVVVTETVPGDCGVFGSIDSEVQILGTDHVTQLAYNDDANGGLCSQASAPGLAAGTYFVRVSASVSSPSLTFPNNLVVEVQ